MKNYIGISRDHSGSMSSIARAAARDYNSNITTIRNAATQSNIETLVSVVECGFGTTSQVRRDLVNENVTSLRSINEYDYSTRGSGTPLFDSVGELIEIFEAVQASTPTHMAVDPYTAMGKEELRKACRNAFIPYGKLNNEGMRESLRAKAGLSSKVEDISFLVMAVTDGGENASCRWNAKSIARKIAELQATDRWTFVFRVPRGGSHQLIRMGIPAGNILEWDQTERGVEVATKATEEAFRGYYSARSRGETSTKKFYSTDMSGVSARTVASKLVNISNDVQFFDVKTKNHGSEIRDFVEQKTHIPFVKGTAFYQLMKTESEVQDYKQIAIRNKKTSEVYSGAAARNMLGLPYNGTVKVVPGNHGAYDIFIQSTSVNRKLVEGTQVLYWANAGSNS